MIPKKSRRPVSQMPLTEANLAYLVCGSLRVLPFWAEKHLSPNSPTYTAPMGGHGFGNTAHRSWTTLRLPDSQEHLTVDPVGMCSPNTTWSLDIWVMQAGAFFSLGTMPLVEQRSVGDVIVVCATLPHVHITLEIGIQAKPTPAGYVGIKVSENTAPLSLFLAIRPYGVSDISPIRDITYLSDGAMMVNKHLGLVLSEPPQNILCLPFSEGDTAHHIGRWEQLLKATCPDACATGFVEYRLSQTTAHLHAWLPLGNQLSFAQDLLKPLEQSQLKTWIQGFKTRTQVPQSQDSRPQTYSLSERLETVLRHLHQRPVSPDTDPWGWAIPLGLLAWTKADTPEHTQINHVTTTENATRLKSNPIPLTACTALSFYAHIGEPPPKDLLQKCIKVALSVPILTQNLPNKYTQNPLDHRFGEGPYFLDYLYAWKTLSLAIGMSPDPQKNQLQHHLSRFEMGFNTTLERWAQEKRVSPMLPLTPTRWEEPGIVTSLLAVFPLALIGITDARIVNTLTTLHQCIYAHAGNRETPLTDKNTVSEHPPLHAETDLLFTRDRGYPIVENLLLAMVYRLQNDMRCKEILSWALAHMSPTGTFPENIHPISHMGSHGTGHHLPASGLFLMVFRHALVHESPSGYHLFHMLPEQCWHTNWTFEVPLSAGTVTVTYTSQTRTVSLKNNTSVSLPCVCHPPKAMWVSEEQSQFVVETGCTHTLSFETVETAADDA